MSRRVVSDEGIVAALPFAAAITLLAARLLPIDFEYHENSLGIVSYATQLHYPHQQEMFWLLFALMVSVAVPPCWIGSTVCDGSALLVNSMLVASQVPTRSRMSGPSMSSRPFRPLLPPSQAGSESDRAALRRGATRRRVFTAASELGDCTSTFEWVV